ITNSGNGSIQGGISSSGNGNISIQNEGSSTIAGAITSSGSGSLSITNSGEATLQSDIINSGSGDLSLNNTGNAEIGANIKNQGSGNLNIKNTGKVSDKTTIESNGSGKINVEQWLVSTNSSGEVKPLEITGSNLAGVSVENITFDAANIPNLSDLANDPKNVINVDTSKDSTISDPNQINNKIFSQTQFQTNDPSVDVNFDALNKTLSFNIESAHTSAAALGKVLISTTQARANFVNSVMNNAMNAAHLVRSTKDDSLSQYDSKTLYAQATNNLQSDSLLQNSLQAQDRNHLFFALPYLSYINTSLANGLTSKGHTKGVIFGYSYFNPNNDDIYGAYFGYDDFRSQTSPVDILSLNNRTYYGGLRYYHPFQYSNQEMFAKLSSQFGLIQNDIYERVGLTEFKAEPKSYAYDANANVGMNLKLHSLYTLTPEVGIGYNGGFSKAYSMSNKVNTITRRSYFHKLNLFKTRASLSLIGDLHKYFKVLLRAGVEYTLNPKVNNPKGRYSNIGHYGGGKSKLDSLEASLGATFAIPLNDAFYFSLNYNANLTKSTTMHTGYAKFNYQW
ncbi:MAG: hypothetical protein K2I63_02550, partial [Helicobacter sp.]|nr:hypothetical protein [Helicobacter sp.]